MNTKTKIIIGLGIVIAGVGGYLYWKNLGAHLVTGWNDVTYTGTEQKATDAFKSIADKLVMAYYWDETVSQWVQVMDDTVLESGMVMQVKVSQDCVWQV